MRVYALINGVSHQKAYVYDLGFVHMCMEDFDANDFGDPQRHNANPVQNAGSDKYVLFEDDGKEEQSESTQVFLHQLFEAIQK